MTFKMRGPMFFGSALKKYGKKSEPVAKMNKKDDDTVMMKRSDMEAKADAVEGGMPSEVADKVFKKKEDTKTPYSHKIPEPFKGNYGQAHHNMDFDSDTSEGKKGHYKRIKH